MSVVCVCFPNVLLLFAVVTLATKMLFSASWSVTVSGEKNGQRSQGELVRCERVGDSGRRQYERLAHGARQSHPAARRRRRPRGHGVGWRLARGRQRRRRGLDGP